MFFGYQMMVFVNYVLGIQEETPRLVSLLENFSLNFWNMFQEQELKEMKLVIYFNFVNRILLSL